MRSNKKTVFLIEDNPAIIDVYKTAFKAAGINAQIMVWGRQAIERIKEVQNGTAEKPCLVLLDLILPDMDGIEILKEIKENEKTKDITVFVLSNYAKGGAPEEGSVKPDRFILKTGISPTELIKLIKKEICVK